MAGLGAYLQDVSKAYLAQNGKALARVLCMEGNQGATVCGEALRPGSRVDIVQMCERQLENPVDEVSKTTSFHATLPTPSTHARLLLPTHTMPHRTDNML